MTASPHSVVILGSGRSGTSMIAGCFAHGAAYLGDALVAGDQANPTGYFEDYELNQLNSRIIHRLLYPMRSYRLLSRFRMAAHRDWRAYWLAAPRRGGAVRANTVLREQMVRYVQHQPFALKDPRFCVTLPTWRPLLPASTRFLVVFREPGRTVDSVLRHARENYDPPLNVGERWVRHSWLVTYERLLQWADDAAWMCVHPDSLNEVSGRTALESFVGAELDFSHIDPNVRRSADRQKEDDPQSRACADLYARLLQRGNADLARWRSEEREREISHATVAE